LVKDVVNLCRLRSSNCDLLELGVNSGSITRNGPLFQNYSPLTVAVNELSKVRQLEQIIFNIGESGIMYEQQVERPSWNIADPQSRYNTFENQWRIFVDKLKEDCKIPKIRSISITNGTNDGFRDEDYGSVASFCTNGTDLLNTVNNLLNAEFGANHNQTVVWLVDELSNTPNQPQIQNAQHCMCNNIGADCVNIPNWQSPDNIHQDEQTTLWMANYMYNFLK